MPESSEWLEKGLKNEDSIAERRDRSGGCGEVLLTVLQQKSVLPEII